MFLILEKIYQGSHTTIQNKVRVTLFPRLAEKTVINKKGISKDTVTYGKEKFNATL